MQCLDLAQERQPVVTIYSVMELLGQLSFNLSEGRLQQWDTPYNLYHEPLTPFVASFIGQGYFIRGQLLSPDTVQTELGVIRGNRAYQWPTGSAVDVLLRPDDIVYAPDSELPARIIV